MKLSPCQWSWVFAFGGNWSTFCFTYWDRCSLIFRNVLLDYLSIFSQITNICLVETLIILDLLWFTKVCWSNMANWMELAFSFSRNGLYCFADFVEIILFYMIAMFGNVEFSFAFGREMLCTISDNNWKTAGLSPYDKEACGNQKWELNRSVTLKIMEMRMVSIV